MMEKIRPLYPYFNHLKLNVALLKMRISLEHGFSLTKIIQQERYDDLFQLLKSNVIFMGNLTFAGIDPVIFMRAVRTDNAELVAAARIRLWNFLYIPDFLNMLGAGWLRRRFFERLNVLNRFLYGVFPSHGVEFCSYKTLAYLRRQSGRKLNNPITTVFLSAISIMIITKQQTHLIHQF